MGWIMVMFDLPVVDPEERRAASLFRTNLLDAGFLMLQESVYTRNCISQERVDQVLSQVKAFAPEKGCITAFYITDYQWTRAVNITLTRTQNKRTKKAGEPMEGQLCFW